MSMPHPKMLIALGCVVSVTTNKSKNRRTLTVYKSEADVRTLHPYFNTGTNAADILAQTATITTTPLGDEVHFIHRGIHVANRLSIWRIRKGMKAPRRVKGPHRLRPKYFYWLKKR